MRFLLQVGLCLLCIAGSVVYGNDQSESYDVILKGGFVVDGTGTPGRKADVGIRGDTIAWVGNLNGAKAKQVVDVSGLVVTPGFINMLSWATESLIQDGNGQSDIRQGITLEVFGEGWSYGPLNENMRKEELASQGDIRYPIKWTSLMGYLDHLVQRGVSPNVASFVGATTVRVHELGYQDRRPRPEELARMCDLVRKEMEAGALGLGTSLIYTPAFYADTDELIALAKVAAEYDGLYVSHMRSEGNQLLEALDELLRIAKEANIESEIYHLKAAGESNWPKLDQVISKVEAARAEGLGVAANMYTYTAGATGLSAAMPPWVQEGGLAAWRRRLMDPKIRAQVIKEMRATTDEWENLLLMSGSPERVLLVGFKTDKLKPLTGKSLAEVAKLRKKSPEETAIDLVIEDNSRIECVYFLMSEENVRKKFRLPWVSFGSDAGALAPEGVFIKSNPHPRAYGCFARILGKYVRDEQLIPLEMAVHKMTGLPAQRLGIRRRGLLQVGYFADVSVIDAQKVTDHATFEKPHRYSTGVQHVLVNGEFVLKNGEHTGNKPGRVVKGQGVFRAEAHRSKPVKLTPEGLAVHRRGYVFDGHNDLPWTIRKDASSSFVKKDISKPQPDMHTDIPRMRKGNLQAQFWSVYVPANTSSTGNSLVVTLEQIDLVKAMVKRYPDVFKLAMNSSDIEAALKEGKIASLIGMEGGHSIENSLGNLRRLYELGARYMTLTHSLTLDWADSATDKPKNNGLSKFGEAVVRDMNRLGMLVDLSHVSVETMKHALRVTEAPVIFSHSSARAVADHVRNVPDDVLRLTARNRGVVMVNFFSGFIEPESAKRMKTMFDDFRKLREEFPDEDEYKQAVARYRKLNPMKSGSVHDVVDHIDHMVRIAGIDHVGIGSDYDGVSMLPKQLEDVSTYPYITQELLNRGYTEAEVHKINSGNVLRVLKEAEQVAKRLQAADK